MNESDVPKNNNNPKGINQYKDCPSSDDMATKKALLELHRRNITDKNLISEILKSEFNIIMSPSTVTRRKKMFGITGSHVTTLTMSELDKRQVVYNQMAKDPNSRQGPRTIKEGIAGDQGVHLTRDYITAVMRAQDPEGFQAREPTAKKVTRTALVALGPHDEWSGDGHDKLSKIGFPIWGVRDVWCGKWLGLYVVPNNRLKLAIAYVWLKIVEEQGGVPIQMTTDCGSETTQVYGLANALREEFSNLDLAELPAHKFLQSIHNTTIERGWLQLRLQWGENVKIFWEAGSEVYNPQDPKQFELVQWLWSTLIQAELNHLRDKFNNHQVRKDGSKKLPSGTSPNIAFSLYEKFGGQNCLQRVDSKVIRKLMEDLGGEKLIRFVSIEYADHASAIFSKLHMPELTMQNVWDVFRAMLPHM